MNRFFSSESERNLWIKLNAERIQYSQMALNGMNMPLGDINEPYSPMAVSNNQLMYDEAYSDSLRYSFEELLTLSQGELLCISEDRTKKKIETIFDSFKIKEL